MPPTRPYQQLNSTVIRGEVMANIIPLVDRTCTVIGTKCVWRPEGGKAGIRRAWEELVEKRNECDSAISRIPGVAFFFSSVSTYQQAKKKKQEEETEEDSEEANIEPSQVHTNSEKSKHAAEAADKKMHPAVAYWIAIQSANGARVEPGIINKALVNCNVEVHPTRACAKSKGSTENLNKLCQVIKDHRNTYMGDLTSESYRHCYEQLAEELTDETEAYQGNICDKVVRLVISNNNFIPLLRPGVKRLTEKGMVLDVFPEAAMTTINQPMQQVENVKPLGNELTVLCNDIERAIHAMKFAVHKGNIHRLVEGSKYTYGRACSIQQFLHSLLGNSFFKERLLKNMKRILNVLEHPESQAIRQITINHDLVEVNDGWVWSFKSRTFLKGEVTDKDCGKMSPRAYIEYDPLKSADAKYFKETILNSLNEDDAAQFCDDFLNLFCLQKRDHKSLVPCLIGPSNSGKTSLFFATTRIIDQARVAKVVKQKQFNKAMINESTELINLDEANEQLMAVDDWKVLLQGGLTAHDTKYKNAQAFISRAPIFITVQKELDFGNAAENKAMDNRLRKYTFKPLPNVSTSAARWIRDNPMDCIVWASSMADKVGRADHEAADSDLSYGSTGLTSNELLGLFDLVLDPPQRSTGDEQDVSEMTQEEEVSQETLSDNLVAEDSASADSDMDSPTEDDVATQLTDKLAILRDETKKSAGLENHGKTRMLTQMIESAEQTVAALVRSISHHRKREKKAREARKRSHQDSLDETLQQKRQEEKKEREIETTKRAFENPWLLNKEKELNSLAERKKETEEKEIRNNLQSLIEIVENQLYMYHKGKGTTGELAIIKRRQVLIRLGVITKERALEVTDISSHVFPRPQEEPSQEETSQEDDGIFLTPPTPLGIRKSGVNYESMLTYEGFLASPPDVTRIPQTPHWSPASSAPETPVSSPPKRARIDQSPIEDYTSQRMWGGLTVPRHTAAKTTRRAAKSKPQGQTTLTKFFPSQK